MEDVTFNRGIQVGDTPLEKIRERLAKMTDEELRRYGKAPVFMCSAEVNFGKPPLDTYVTQLAEARAEWRRRHPPSHRAAKRHCGHPPQELVR